MNEDVSRDPTPEQVNMYVRLTEEVRNRQDSPQIDEMMQVRQISSCPSLQAGLTRRSVCKQCFVCSFSSSSNTLSPPPRIVRGKEVVVFGEPSSPLSVLEYLFVRKGELKKICNCFLQNHPGCFQRHKKCTTSLVDRSHGARGPPA